MSVENPLDNKSWPKKNKIPDLPKVKWSKKNLIPELPNTEWPEKNLIPDVPEKKKKGNNSNIFKDDSLK